MAEHTTSNVEEGGQAGGGGSTGNANVGECTVESFAAPIAKAVDNVHAAFAGNDAANIFPGPITDPDMPRSLYATFGAGYDGGDLTVDGTDIDDNVIQEVLATNPGGDTKGVKCFKTVTQIAKASVGANPATASVGVHDKIGVSGTPLRKVGVISVDGSTEHGTWDDGSVSAEERGFTPGTNVPDGARDYDVMFAETNAHSHAAIS